MKKLGTKLFVLVMAMSLMFSMTASANPAIVSYGGTYNNALAASQSYAYILPNAKTTGTSVTVITAVPNTLQLHYYWSYNNTTLDLGTAIVNSTYYIGGSAYYNPGTLITVVERVPGSTTAYPSVSYSISFK
ncbi:hypothetical protein BBD42_03380 [Paenibacillus sp. BIHB 4019]|uniref:DUF4879 domain-containing protein n=1 Tax=Paenibacillus sp. BIHB 4019 TaxID=1870819 RepID=A0A1B2DD21_9BACL|nr:hypothetical protein [Paenibacillus sp. BIHB 4019]ANY65606.1 hypothetical protein BBD42_03380 [Paenibacillus sp. BIHB 4019]